MDIDDYESLNDEFKVVESQSKGFHFFTSNEMFKDTTIPKDEVSFDEMIGDPSRGKSIKMSRPAVYDIHTASSSTNAPRPSQKKLPSFLSQPPSRPSVNYTVCPICSDPAVRTCKCDKRDSMCANSHKWYVKDGKIMLGHTH